MLLGRPLPQSGKSLAAEDPGTDMLDYGGVWVRMAKYLYRSCLGYNGYVGIVVPEPGA
jgi:hypothetical protein